MTLQTLELAYHIIELNQYSPELAESTKSIQTRETRAFHESRAIYIYTPPYIYNIGPMKSELNTPF